MSGLPIYINIDGTLTTAHRPGGAPNLERIDSVRDMIERGMPVVIWSAGGTEYAQEFCARYKLSPVAALGKPSYCIDDNPNLRPGFLVVSPDELNT